MCLESHTVVSQISVVSCKAFLCRLPGCASDGFWSTTKAPVLTQSRPSHLNKLLIAHVSLQRVALPLFSPSRQGPTSLQKAVGHGTSKPNGGPAPDVSVVRYMLGRVTRSRDPWIGPVHPKALVSRTAPRSQAIRSSAPVCNSAKRRPRTVGTAVETPETIPPQPNKGKHGKQRKKRTEETRENHIEAQRKQ